MVGYGEEENDHDAELRSIKERHAEAKRKAKATQKRLAATILLNHQLLYFSTLSHTRDLSSIREDSEGDDDKDESALLPEWKEVDELTSSKRKRARERAKGVPGSHVLRVIKKRKTMTTTRGERRRRTLRRREGRRVPETPLEAVAMMSSRGGVTV